VQFTTRYYERFSETGRMDEGGIWSIDGKKERPYCPIAHTYGCHPYVMLTTNSYSSHWLFRIRYDEYLMAMHDHLYDSSTIVSIFSESHLASGL